MVFLHTDDYFYRHILFVVRKRVSGLQPLQLPRTVLMLVLGAPSKLRPVFDICPWLELGSALELHRVRTTLFHYLDLRISLAAPAGSVGFYTHKSRRVTERSQTPETPSIHYSPNPFQCTAAQSKHGDTNLAGDSRPTPMPQTQRQHLEPNASMSTMRI